MIHLTLSDWILTLDAFNAMQYDDKSIELQISGDIPDGYTWHLLYQHDDDLDVILLENSGEILTHTLTEENLAFSGMYRLQLQGTAGDIIRHSSVALITLPGSLSGDAQWPKIPTAFSQALLAAETAAQESEASKQAAEEAAASIHYYAVRDPNRDGNITVEEVQPNGTDQD